MNGLKERLIEAIQKERIGKDVSIPQNLVVDEIERIIEREFSKDVKSTKSELTFIDKLKKEVEAEIQEAKGFGGARADQSVRVFEMVLMRLNQFPENNKSIHPTWKDQVEELFSDKPQGCGKREYIKVGTGGTWAVCGCNNGWFCSECREDTKSALHKLPPTSITSLTEVEFLEWLYGVIGDDSIDYMWEISRRMTKLKSVQDTFSAPKGCGKAEEISYNPRITQCGIIRDCKLYLCEECREDRQSVTISGADLCGCGHERIYHLSMGCEHCVPSKCPKFVPQDNLAPGGQE